MRSKDTYQIWNRAALEAGGQAPLEGDRRLADLLLAHGLVMNGGVEHMIQALTSAELSAAVKGFRYFRFDEIARLLEDSVEASENQQEQADIEYGKLIDDRSIAERFAEYYRRNPEAFAPVDL